jgi:hypothetical protein
VTIFSPPFKDNKKRPANLTGLKIWGVKIILHVNIVTDLGLKNFRTFSAFFPLKFRFKIFVERRKERG